MLEPTKHPFQVHAELIYHEKAELAAMEETIPEAEGALELAGYSAY